MKLVVAWLGIALVAAASGEDAPRPLQGAHAHNDYEHPRPLSDALSHGFCGVEADVFLVGGELLVAHDRRDLKPGRTLQALYLDPLRARVATNGGTVYAGSELGFTLLIDIKSEGRSTYEVLAEVLAGYGEILTGTRDGETTVRAVTAVVSGDRAVRDIAADDPRWVGIDGRLADLGSDFDRHLLPLISDRWGRHFSWKGEGEMPAAEREKLRGIVERAHASGRRVRFWATPEKVAVWRELRTAGVDLINTDELAKLRDFLLRG